jgi:hypothetical protein
MDILQFFFGNIWHFIGLVIVLCIVGEIILKSIALIVGYKESDIESREDCPYECLSCKFEYCPFDKKIKEE